MKKAIVFLANGFEEMEALGTVDILRRGGIEVTTVSITTDPVVIGARAAACRTAYGVRLRQDCRLLRTRLERNAGAYGRFGAGHYRLRQSHRKGLHPIVGRNTKRIHTGVWQ